MYRLKKTVFFFCYIPMGLEWSAVKNATSFRSQKMPCVQTNYSAAVLYNISLMSFEPYNLKSLR